MDMMVRRERIDPNNIALVVCLNYASVAASIAIMIGAYGAATVRSGLTSFVITLVIGVPLAIASVVPAILVWGLVNRIGRCVPFNLKAKSHGSEQDTFYRGGRLW